MKEFIQKYGKKMAFACTTAMTVVGTSVMSFAAEGPDISGALTTGVGEIQTQAMAAIGSVAPVAIAITGATLALRVALRVFRSTLS